MSGLALGWAKQQRAPSIVAKALLVALADYADADGLAWPKIKTLSQEVQASPRTVQRALKALEDDGLIVCEPRYRSDGSQSSNGYRLPLPHDNLPPPHDIVTPPPCQDVTPPMTLVSPPIELPLEPSPSDEGEKPAKAKARKKPSVRIPADFPHSGLIADQQAKVESEGYDLNVASEAEKFRNHAEQTDRDCVDWSAAFRNWIIKAKGWAPRRTATVWDDARWNAALALHREEGLWSDKLGPPPGQPGCRVPAHLANPPQDRAA